jgi:hypothetical protein
MRLLFICALYLFILLYSKLIHELSAESDKNQRDLQHSSTNPSITFSFGVCLYAICSYQTAQVHILPRSLSVIRCKNFTMQENYFTNNYWMWGGNYALVSLSTGKNTLYPLDRRLSGPENWSRWCGEEKINDLTGSRTLTPRSSRP